MDAIDEFESIVDAIYGVFLDSTHGFFMLMVNLGEQQRSAIELIRKHNPEMADNEPINLGDAMWMYGKDDPNEPGARALHATTQREFAERNNPNGRNYLFIGNMTLVAIFQYWEDNYRLKIAQLLGKATKNEVLEPIMGDLRLLRNSIVHHSGIALDEVEKCELLQWFKEGDTIFLDYDKFEALIGHIREMLVRLRAQVGK